MPAAIVLAGGQSRRMGSDKATLVVDGMTMVERVQSVLVSAGVSDIVVAGPTGVPDSADDAGEGPLAGVLAGWSHLTSDGHRPDPVVVVSCDLVGLTQELVADLVDASVLHRHGVVAFDGERRQPLVGAYRPAAIEAIERAFAAGERSLRRCLSDWDLGHVPAAAAAVADADSPSDLAAFDVQWPV